MGNRKAFRSLERGTDSVQSDISVFIFNMPGNNPRFDFNLDGEVDGSDLKILREVR